MGITRLASDNSQGNILALDDVLNNVPWPWKPHLNYMWYYDGDRISVNVETFVSGDSINTPDRRISSIHCTLREAIQPLTATEQHQMSPEDEAVFQWLLENLPPDQRAVLHTLKGKERAKRISELRSKLQNKLDIDDAAP